MRTVEVYHDSGIISLMHKFWRDFLLKLIAAVGAQDLTVLESVSYLKTKLVLGEFLPGNAIEHARSNTAAIASLTRNAKGPSRTTSDRLAEAYALSTRDLRGQGE